MIEFDLMRSCMDFREIFSGIDRWKTSRHYKNYEKGIYKPENQV